MLFAVVALAGACHDRFESNVCDAVKRPLTVYDETPNTILEVILASRDRLTPA